MLGKIVFFAICSIPVLGQSNTNSAIEITAAKHPYAPTEFIKLEKAHISPDGDGQDDSLVINYDLAGSENFCSMRIFNSNGETVKILLKSEAISGIGRVLWDGSTINNGIAPAGYYNLVSEVWSEKGNIRRFRSRVIVN